MAWLRLTKSIASQDETDKFLRIPKSEITFFQARKHCRAKRTEFSNLKIQLSPQHCQGILLESEVTSCCLFTNIAVAFWYKKD